MKFNKVEKLNSRGAWTKSLVLGTASWGNDYGVMNNFTIPVRSLRQVIRFAEASGVAGLDTAPAYGESEKQIGRAGTFGLPVYSKLSRRNGKPNAAIASVENSLTDLGVTSLQGLTFHDASDFLAHHKSSVQECSSLKERGKIRSWGVSVYTVEELNRIFEVSQPDFIQAPANFFDRRFLKPTVRALVESTGAYFQYRSIFLQGILLADEDQIPPYFRRWDRAFKLMRESHERFDLCKLSHLLSFVVSATSDSQYVVGINSLSHLQDLVSADVNYDLPMEELGFDEDWLLPLIDPRRWQR